MRILLIVNPKAGKGKGKQVLFALCNGLCAMQHEIIVEITQHRGHAQALLIQYGPNVDCVICCGGDGTWNETVCGMMTLVVKPLIAYLPCGTVNDFANTWKLPANAKDFLQSFARQQHFLCDIGQCNERFFTYVAAFGMFTDIAHSTSQNAKNSFGKIAYFMEGLKQLTNMPSYHIHVQTETESFTEDCIFGCITNSKYVGGFSAIHRDDMQLDDGLFEVLLIRTPNNPLDIQAIVAALLKREIHPTWMRFFTAGELQLSAEQEVPWTLDGEDGGKLRHVHIRNHQKALDLLL